MSKKLLKEKKCLVGSNLLCMGRVCVCVCVCVCVVVVVGWGVGGGGRGGGGVVKDGGVYGGGGGCARVIILNDSLIRHKNHLGI